jgi:hypothetical protein
VPASSKVVDDGVRDLIVPWYVDVAVGAETRTARIDFIYRVPARVPVQIDTAVIPDGVAVDEAAGAGIVVAVREQVGLLTEVDLGGWSCCWFGRTPSRRSSRIVNRRLELTHLAALG